MGEAAMVPSCLGGLAFLPACGQKHDQVAPGQQLGSWASPQTPLQPAAAMPLTPQLGLQMPARTPLMEIRQPAPYCTRPPPEQLATAAAAAQSSSALPRHAAMAERDVSRRRRLREVAQGATTNASTEGNSENEEWYNTLMSRLRRLGGDQQQACRPSQGSRLDEGSDNSVMTEPFSSSFASRRSGRGERLHTSGSNARSTSRDALHAKLREMSIDRQNRPMAAEAPLPATSRGTPVPPATAAACSQNCPSAASDGSVT